MSKIGADLSQLSTLTRAFNQEAGQVEQLITTINGQINNTWWVGPAADKFKDQWNSQFVPTLRNLQEALRNASADVENRRQRIEAAGS